MHCSHHLFASYLGFHNHLQTPKISKPHFIFLKLCLWYTPFRSNESRPHSKENLISSQQAGFYSDLDYMISSHIHILCSESAIIFLVVLSVKINFTIPSNKMVSNDIFNQQAKMLSSNWDKLSQKVTKIWQDGNYICNFNWNVNFPLSVLWTMSIFQSKEIELNVTKSYTVLSFSNISAYK